MMVKINRKLIVVSCLLPLFLLCSTLIAAQERDPAKGIIGGTIINETLNGASVENQEVILYVQKENSGEETFVAKSDSSGTFEFPDLSTEAAYTYYLYLNYQGGEYTSATVNFQENQTRLALDLVVYDATTSAEKVEIAIDHIIIEKAEKGALLISESMTFRNSGDRTYVGTKNQASGAYEVLRIPLPAGYQDIQYIEGLMECCVSQSEYGLSDSMDLKPGLKKVLLQYRLPYGGRSSLVNKSFQYRTAAFYILAPAPLELSGESLTLEGPLEIQGRQYVALGGGRNTCLQPNNLQDKPTTFCLAATHWASRSYINFSFCYDRDFLFSFEKKRGKGSSCENNEDRIPTANRGISKS